MKIPCIFRFMTLSMFTGSISSLVLITSFTFIPTNVQAQVLEEIVVTAQRREQSLQEVPLSIEAFSGAELDDQGYRNMEDLSAFSPTVSINGSSVQDQAVRIRGFGTTGNSLTLEQAVPIFVDGIHFGRQSMIKTAFLDAAQVEVLKGPQPVFFGMNATAGAFNITSRKPTDTWEGNIVAEAGNNGQQELSFGVGGPITDTLGIRVAGIREKNDGIVKHYITGQKMPRYDHLGGRITLQWTPNDNFDATFKVEGSRLRNGADVSLLCLTGDSLIYTRDSPTNSPRAVGSDPTIITDEGHETAVWADPPTGEAWDTPHQPLDTAPDCFKSKYGWGSEAGYLAPPLNIHEENSYTGAIDIRRAAEAFSSAPMGTGGLPQEGGALDTNGTIGHDGIDTRQVYLDLNYRLNGGIEINSKTAGLSFYRDPVRDNSNSPFLLNYQGRIEDFNQWSSELRLTSPSGGYDVGTGSLEWMVGLFWQSTNKDHFSSSLRGNVRRGQRFNWLWEDSTWKSAFATVTFNFMGDKASIDLGGRLANVKKEVFIQGYGATWVFDSMPCEASSDDDIGGGNFDPASCTPHEDALMVDADTVRFLLPEADATNLWTLPFGESRETPSNWRSPRTYAVGLTAPDGTVRNGPNSDKFSVTEFDPQVTLRYRPTANHSIYARWAQAFKAAGYDTGQTSIEETLDTMKFDSERATTYEFGSKGMLWDGRVRYDVNFFLTEFKDLQLSGAAPTGADQNSVSLNAGKQTVKGFEFAITGAVTDRLTLGLAGAIMDAELKEFTGVGCSFAEFVNTDQNLGIQDLWPCTNLAEGTTDESGRQPAGIEEVKFVPSLDYRMPLGDYLQGRFNAKGFITGGGRPGSSFDRTYGDLNILAGIGDQNEVWEVSFYGRHLLEPRPRYHRELDVPGQRDGLATTGETTSSNLFMTYGVQVRYNFR